MADVESIMDSRKNHYSEKKCKFLTIGLDLVVGLPNPPGISNTPYNPINDITKALEFSKKLKSISDVFRIMKLRKILNDRTKTYDDRYNKFIVELDYDELNHLYSMDDELESMDKSS